MNAWDLCLKMSYLYVWVHLTKVEVIINYLKKLSAKIQQNYSSSCSIKLEVSIGIQY